MVMRRWGGDTSAIWTGRCWEGGRTGTRISKDDEKRRRWHIAAKDLGQAVSDLGTAVQAKEQARRWPHDELDKPDSTCWHAEALKR